MRSMFDYFNNSELILDALKVGTGISREELFHEVREYFEHDDTREISYDNIVNFVENDSYYMEALFSEYNSIFPESDLENDNDGDSCLGFDDMSEETLYMHKFGFETEISVPSIFSVIDPDYIPNRQKWILDINRLIDETDFQNWKNKYISEQLAEYKQKNKKILVCEYSFIGNGNFTEYISEDYFPHFEQFIAKNITAMHKEPVVANDKQAEIFLGLNVLDEYYGLSRYNY